ncbi:MAG: hypothetical protein R8P61_29555 [Bacteroidia bacterium]|nr:hypothetical protein [Bacteroidia bacterium]
MRNSLITIISLAFFFSSSLLFGQEGMYNFDKRIAPNANGISIEIQEEAQYLEAALRSKFEKIGQKKPKSMKKGLYMYEAVVLSEVSDATLNYYYRVESSGNNSSSVSLFLSPGNNNFWSSEKFPDEMRRAEQFLYALEVEVATIKVQEKILAQKELIEKEEKEEKDLQKEEEDMVKEIEKLEKQIEETKKAILKNQDDQESQAKLLEGERKKLAELIKELELIIKR